MKIGYFQEPAILGSQLIFRADDNLWTMSLGAEIPQQLTQCRGIPQNPAISPDGQWLAFTGTEEGLPEVYVMPLKGGSLTRLTYSGSPGSRVIGWTPDSRSILFTTASSSTFRDRNIIQRIDQEGGHPVDMRVGYGASLSFGPRGGMVLGRFGREPAFWKRYRGGRAGEIWIDPEGTGKFHRLLELESNLTHPMWIGERIYFIGDHDGSANVYSCDLEAESISQHTFYNDFYIRNPQTDGKSIVFQKGAELFLLTIADHVISPIAVRLPSSFPQLRKKMPMFQKHIESIDIHPSNRSCLTASRGKLFHFSYWEGGVQTFGKQSGIVRYRLPQWLNDGKRFVAVSDESGEEQLVVFSGNPLVDPIVLKDLQLNRVTRMRIVPGADVLILSNNHEELVEVDLETGAAHSFDRSAYHRLTDFDVSPDGRWIAYSCSIDPHRMAVKVFDRQNRTIHIVTDPVLLDKQPVFDPEGKYLYFLSSRIFNPVRDNLDFNYGFPRGIIPMAITLQSDLLNPFDPVPESPCENCDGPGLKTPDPETNAKETKPVPPVRIDMEGIRTRAVAMPVPDGVYYYIQASKDRIWLLEGDVEGTLSRQKSGEKPTGYRLLYFSLKTLSSETYMENVSDFFFSRDRKVLACRTPDGLRVLDASKVPAKNDSTQFGKKTGWVNLARLKATIDPKSEWLQMYREAWRLMRDTYFAEDMSGVNWDAMFERYRPLVMRCSTRSELSDIIWECYGELGTSHSYEIGGEYDPHPDFSQGMLGIDLFYDAGLDRYVISHIVKGDSWEPSQNSPLNMPGIRACDGNHLIAINGQSVTWKVPPGQLLLGMNGQTVTLTLSDGESDWDINVKAVGNESAARLREWVNLTTEYVHRKTDGRVGYLYVQDMGTTGFAQFHRAWLAESHRDAMIIDVRHNGGGHVSSLLLEKLSRKRLGYCATRHSPIVPVPDFCIRGPMVALCDEFSGSDGDLFSHKFKMMKLGTLIGRRTWGGVVGIAPQHLLVDGTIVTQPEFYHWFDDEGWELENRGATPDITIDFKPQHVANGDDPQLEYAITHINRLLEANPPVKPNLGMHPRRSFTP